MKLCQDCKHYSGGSFGECRRKVLHQDPVTGRKTYPYAERERSQYEDCGPEGDFWEAPEPKTLLRSLKRFKNWLVRKIMRPFR